MFDKTLAFRTPNAIFYMDASRIFDQIKVQRDYDSLFYSDNVGLKEKLNQLKEMKTGDTIVMEQHGGYREISFFAEKMVGENVKTGEISVFDIKANKNSTEIKVVKGRSVLCHQLTIYNKENGSELWYYLYDCKGHL